MIRSAWVWFVTVLASSLGIGSLVLLESSQFSTIRAFLALWFLLICPGMPFVRLLRVKESVTELTLAVALSLAVDSAVAIVLIYTGYWSAKLALSILIGISVAGAILLVVQRPSKGR